jgi:hypothetical protein
MIILFKIAGICSEIVTWTRGTPLPPPAPNPGLGNPPNKKPAAERITVSINLQRLTNHAFSSINFS